MQNPFRNQDQPGRPDHDEHRMEGGDRRPEEYRSWGGGDGGRTAEAFRGQGREQDYDPARDPGRERAGAAGWGYGQNQQSHYGQGMSTPYSGDRGPGGPYGPGGYQTGAQAYGAAPQLGQDYGSQGYGARSFDQRGYGQSGRSGAYSSPAGPGYASPSYGGQTYGGQGYGAESYGQAYGGSTYGSQGGLNQGYASHGYAPGSQIWEGSGRGMGGQTHEHHDFEPDYLHWRQQQLSAFDKDYSDWRNERREKFSSDFASWRQNRPRVQAENPIVGDVADGGTGNAAEAKKR